MWEVCVVNLQLKIRKQDKDGNKINFTWIFILNGLEVEFTAYDGEIMKELALTSFTFK